MRMRSRRVRPRLERLEAAAPEDELPYLCVCQGLEDREGFYTGSPWGMGVGERYTRADFPELEKRYRLIVVEYVRNWRDRRGCPDANE